MFIRISYNTLKFFAVNPGQYLGNLCKISCKFQWSTYKFPTKAPSPLLSLTLSPPLHLELSGWHSEGSWSPLSPRSSRWPPESQGHFQAPYLNSPSLNTPQAAFTIMEILYHRYLLMLSYVCLYHHCIIDHQLLNGKDLVRFIQAERQGEPQGKRSFHYYFSFALFNFSDI